MTQTIFALASGSMRAGVAVLRVSGPQARATVRALCGHDDITPRQAALRKLADPKSKKTIDRALVLFFQGPASFTGEDTVEYHVHGGRAVIEGLLAALGNIADCRLAEPGEFTRRAFENGKMDLTEAEAVADLIAAETEAQRMQALGQLEGGLSRLYQGWTERLSGYLAHQEADIEFPEDDMPQGVSVALTGGLKALHAEISAHLDDNRRGEILRDGLRIAIVGAPNAGKSSLLNALARRDAAIVSDEAGTTRDVIEVHLDLGGYPAIVADTAGLRETGHRIEAEGIRRAQETARRADIRIALFDAGKPQDAETRALVDENTIVVFNKSDLHGKAAGSGFCISAMTGDGMQELLGALSKKAAALVGAQGDMPALTRARHRAALEEARDAIGKGLAAGLPELAAEDMRIALRALGRITGRVHVEELLDKIFRDFCIGK
jgi:tRNA modification GTPase